MSNKLSCVPFICTTKKMRPNLGSISCMSEGDSELSSRLLVAMSLMMCLPRLIGSTVQVS